MTAGYTPDQLAFQRRLRFYLDELMTPTLRADLAENFGVTPTYRAAWKQMCADGWAGVGWPVEWGGQGRSRIEQFIFFDECMRAGAPVALLALTTVGPTILEFGTDEQRAYFLPKILAGELHFSIGYTEPDAGTDLASLTTTARRDGDMWVINGRKTFVSLAAGSDYLWLAARTNADAAKHNGISVFIVPLPSEGLALQPMSLLSEHNTCDVFLDDVRVPERAIIGEVDQGWRLITNQLNLERVSLCSPGIVEAAYQDVLRWARETRLPDGQRVMDQEWVRVNLARVHAGLAVLRLLTWKVSMQSQLDIADCSSAKVFGTELYQEAFGLLFEIVGPQAYVARGRTTPGLDARLEFLYRQFLMLTFGGGTNELQRDLIAGFGLRMPVAAR